MIELVGLYFWLALSLVVALLADRCGRSWGFWFLLSLIFTPLVCGLLVLAMGPKVADDGEIRLSRGG